MVVQRGDLKQGVSQTLDRGKAARAGLIRETGVYSEDVAKKEPSFLSTLSPRSLGRLFVATFDEWRQDTCFSRGWDSRATIRFRVRERD